MAKLLKDVLKGKNTSTKVTNDLGGYKPKAGDEERFAKKHEIEKHDHTDAPEHQFKGGTKEAPFKKQKEGVYEAKKAEDAQCNRSPKGTECPVHGLAECWSSGTIKEKSLKEVLSKKDPASKWIHDFVHSKNPKFDGKSTKERQKQALAAYYAKQRNEETDPGFAEGTVPHDYHQSRLPNYGLNKSDAATMSKVASMMAKEKAAQAAKKKQTVKEWNAVEPLLGGDQPPRGGSDEAAEMVKTELKALANKALHLAMQMPDNMHVEPWVQAKIATAKEHVSAVHDYMIYGDHDKENEQTDTPMTFPNMSVDVNTGQNV
jgi:hypothetical protein